MFVPALSLIEVIVRGTIMYLARFAILRFIGRRQAGHFGPADLLVIVLIADAAQNALGKDYQSGLGVHARLARVAVSGPAEHPEGPALTLVENGRVLERNLRKARSADHSHASAHRYRIS